MKGLRIESLTDDGIASEQGIEPGDRLISMNGHPVRDIIDYHYLNDGDDLLIEIEKPDGSLWECEIDGDLPLGLVFQAPKPMHCRNNCIFCFVHQLPKGLRKPLYVKDEDYKLSFLYGNYVTLANISKADLSRIKKQRLSPLYISVHASDPVLREELLGKQGITPILEVMESLADSGIVMHTQIVLCPGINDGEYLKQTVADLAGLFPNVASIAVVPIGLTIHRKGLPHLNAVTAEYAASFIREWEPEAKSLAKELGEPFLFLADEFYLKADMPFPPISTYGDFPQLENGVGMIQLFRKEVLKVLKKSRKMREGSATIVTGFSALPVIEDFLAGLSEHTGLALKGIAVQNRLFGSSVTVAGLVAGRDIIDALKGIKSGEFVVIPDVMLKEAEGVFLDDLAPGDIARELNVKVVVAETSPRGLYDVLKREFQSK
jgi:putative radical SAM enzyme (TIGR03279 family)